MNKEEILNTFLLANIPEIIAQEEFNDVKKAIKDLQQENKILKENAENNDKVVDKIKNAIDGDIDGLLKENQELKKQIEQYQEEVCILDMRTDENIKLINQQKEFIKYLEDEKDRLVRECSQIYEDFLGKTRLVNEDIFNEVDTILSKYKEIMGDDNK